jgi:hypothetical protein
MSLFQVQTQEQKQSAAVGGFVVEGVKKERGQEDHSSVPAFTVQQQIQTTKQTTFPKNPLTSNRSLVTTAVASPPLLTITKTGSTRKARKRTIELLRSEAWRLPPVSAFATFTVTATPTVLLGTPLLPLFLFLFLIFVVCDLIYKQ